MATQLSADQVEALNKILPEDPFYRANEEDRVELGIIPAVYLDKTAALVKELRPFGLSEQAKKDFEKGCFGWI